MAKYFLILFVFIASVSKAQKVENIFFNLYTDSLKKGVHNYINVDGKLSNGTFYPLLSSEVIFASDAGKWEGNSIIIDSSFTRDSVTITASLKANPSVTKKVVIYIKKSSFEGEMKSEKELIEQWRESIKSKSRRKT